VCPHAEDLYGSEIVEHLIDESVLDIDAARISAGEVADQFLEGRRSPSGILSKNLEKFLGFPSEPAAGDLSRVLLRLLGKYNPPGGRSVYQPGFADVFDSGVRNPFRIDSRIPGIDSR